MPKEIPPAVEPKIIAPAVEPKIIPHEVEHALKWWNYSAIILRVVFAALTTLSLICSVIVGSSTATVAAGSLADIGFLEFWHIAVLSMTAAAAVAILAAFDVRGNADRFRKAWVWLHGALTDYKYQEDYDMKKLIDVYKDAEKLILRETGAKG